MSARWHGWQYPLDAVSTAVPLVAGARIANARGIPGTIGFLALTRADRQLVLVTAHHVLFGAGARAGDLVWLVDSDIRPVAPVARTLYGRAGIVRHDGTEVYVDCAVAAIEAGALGADWGSADFVPPASPPVAGDPVIRISAAGDPIEGEVLDTAYAAVRRIDGRLRTVPGQLRIGAARSGTAFSQRGDSGTLIRNHDDRPVGLLWGIAPDGTSVAAPIEPVLWILNVEPAQPSLETESSAEETAR